MPDNPEELFHKGLKVDSVGGRFKGGEIMAVRKEGNMLILRIKWANGLVQERSSRTVYIY